MDLDNIKKQLGRMTTEKDTVELFGIIVQAIEEVRKAMVKDIATIDEKLVNTTQTLEEGVTEALKIASETSKQEGPIGEKGEKGDTGDTYILTESDKKEIAKKVEVPVVTKVVEVQKTEVIKEQPIVTNEIVKEIITEFDTTDIDNQIRELQDEIDKLKKRPLGTTGRIFGRAGVQVLGSNVKIGTKANEINFGTGLTAVDENGRITVTASSGLGTPIEMTPAPDDTTLVYTAASAFTVIVVNGFTYRENHGFTKSGLVATLNQPVGQFGDIYCL